MVSTFPSNTWPGNRVELHLHLLADAEGRAVMPRRHSPASTWCPMLATVYGRRRIAGLQRTIPALALRAVIRPVDWAWHDKSRIGAAVGNDAVDIGVGLAEQTHRIARRRADCLRRFAGRRWPARRRVRKRHGSYRGHADVAGSWCRDPKRPAAEIKVDSACNRSGLSMVNSV